MGDPCDLLGTRGVNHMMCRTYCIAFFALIAASSFVTADTNAGDWPVEKVVEWSASLGLKEDSVKLLKKGVIDNKVDGTVLLHVTEEDLRDDIGIESSLQRKVIMSALAELKGKNQGHKGMNFWQYRSMHRKEMDGLMLLISNAPRVAISKFPTTLPEHGRPAKPLGGGHSTLAAWFEWLIIPEYYIYLNAHTIAGGLPGFMPWVILGQLIIKGFTLLALAFKKDPAGVMKQVGQTLIGEVCFAVGAWVWMNILWPIVPWFICDLIFYFMIYVAPLIPIVIGLMGLGAVLGIGALAMAAAKID